MNRLNRFVCFLGWLLFISGCDGEQTVEELPAQKRSSKLLVVTVNSPLEEFARRLGGSAVEVSCPCPIDIDPAHWKPTERHIDQLQSADLVILNGLGYSTWTSYISLAPSKVIDSSVGFKSNYLEADESQVHRHGDGEHHKHSEYATHVWLNPRLALLQAEAIRNELIRRLPDCKQEIDISFRELEAELNMLDIAVQKIERPGLRVIGSHPVFEYLADHCDWQLSSVVWEPTTTPTESEWVAFEKLTNDTKAKLMLWEAEPTTLTRERLQTMGIAVVVFEPCGRIASGDYFEKMQANINRLRVAVQDLAPRS